MAHAVVVPLHVHGLRAGDDGGAQRGELGVDVLVQRAEVALVPGGVVVAGVRVGGCAVHQHVLRVLAEADRHVEVVGRRERLGVDLQTHQVVLVLDVRHRERHGHLDRLRRLRLLRGLRRVARRALRHAEARHLVAVHVQDEAAARGDSGDHAAVGGGGVQVEAHAVVAALGLRRGDVLVGGLGPGVDEGGQVPVGGRVLRVDLVAPLGAVVVEHQREEGLLLEGAHHGEGLDQRRAGDDLHLARPGVLRVVVEGDHVVGRGEAVGVVDGGVVVLEAVVLAHHLARVHVRHLVVHVAAVAARLHEVHVGQLLAHAALRDVHRHHHRGRRARHRHAGDRVRRVLHRLAHRAVDNTRRADEQALGQRGRRREGRVEVRRGRHGRDGRAGQALDDHVVVAQRRDVVRVLQQEVEEAQTHGVRALRLHGDAVHAHAADGHGVGDVEAAALAALREEDAALRGDARPGLTVDGHRHVEGLGLRAALLRGGHQAVLVDLLHALARPGELEEGLIVQVRRQAVVHLAVEQVVRVAVARLGGERHAVRDDAHRGAQHHRRGEVQLVRRRVRVHHRHGEGVGARVQVVGSGEAHEREGIQILAAGGGGGGGGHGARHVAAVHLDAVQVHDHAGARGQAQLVGVHVGVRGDGHLAAEEPHGLRHGGQRLGDGAPLVGEVRSEPVLGHGAVGQVGPAGRLAGHDEAQREGDGGAEAHAAVGADGEGGAVGQRGEQRHVGAGRPVDVVVVAELERVVALGQAEGVGLGARGNGRRAERAVDDVGVHARHLRRALQDAVEGRVAVGGDVRLDAQAAVVALALRHHDHQCARVDGAARLVALARHRVGVGVGLRGGGHRAGHLAAVGVEGQPGHQRG